MSLSTMRDSLLFTYLVCYYLTILVTVTLMLIFSQKIVKKVMFEAQGNIQ